MKQSKKSIFLVSLVIAVSMFSIPLFTIAGPLPPGPGDYLAEDYVLIIGNPVSGSKESTYYNDASYLTVQATISGLIIRAWVKFYFPDFYYDKIKFDFIDNEGYFVTTGIKVYYTTGDPERLPNRFESLRDGYYEFDLDSSRHINYVVIEYEHAWFFPDILKIDMIRLTIL